MKSKEEKTFVLLTIRSNPEAAAPPYAIFVGWVFLETAELN
jgi:hypothetical protein